MKVRELIHELLDYPMDSDVVLEVRVKDKLYHNGVMVLFEDEETNLVVSGDESYE